MTSFKKQPPHEAKAKVIAPGLSNKNSNETIKSVGNLIHEFPIEPKKNKTGRILQET